MPPLHKKRKPAKVKKRVGIPGLRGYKPRAGFPGAVIQTRRVGKDGHVDIRVPSPRMRGGVTLVMWYQGSMREALEWLHKHSNKLGKLFD